MGFEMSRTSPFPLTAVVSTNGPPIKQYPRYGENATSSKPPSVISQSAVELAAMKAEKKVSEDAMARKAEEYGAGVPDEGATYAE